MITCPSCHDGVQIDGEPEDGDQFVCPCCAAELVYHFDENDQPVLTEAQ